MKIEHSFNEHGKVESKIHFLCAKDAIEFGREFKDWNVNPVDEKDLKKGFYLTVRRNP